MAAAIVIVTFVIALLAGGRLGSMIWEQTDKRWPRRALTLGGSTAFGLVYIGFQLLYAR